MLEVFLRIWVGPKLNPTKLACKVRIASTYKAMFRPSHIQCGYLNNVYRFQHHFAGIEKMLAIVESRDAHDEVTKQMWDIVYGQNDETMQILLIMRENARS
jgi:superfamily II helicase